MGLKDELLAVLDNPVEVWATVLNNLDQHPRTLVLVFTTCPPGTGLVQWQSATARVSLEAASRFEAALRPLDDSFVAVRRSPDGRDSVSFRNPSMEDFCVAYLNSNVGFAISVAEKRPTLAQIMRLIKLANAQRDRVPRSPALHEAFVAEPSRLLAPLIELLGERERAGGSPDDVVGVMLELVASANRVRPIRKATLARLRALVRRTLITVDFTKGAHRAYTLLARENRAYGAKVVLGEEFGAFYEQLWKSASVLGDFDRMVDIDDALGSNGADADWRTHFDSLSDYWSPEASQESDLDAVKTERDKYVRVVDYLGEVDCDYSQEWEEFVERMELDLFDRSDDFREQWYDDRNRRQSAAQAGDPSSLADRSAARDSVDTMFDGLVTRPER